MRARIKSLALFYYVKGCMFMEIYNGSYCVYIHINKINGKKYVGQTIHGDNPQRRWVNGNGYKKCSYFYNAIQKYGWDNFEHEVIASNLTEDEADNFERLLIEKLDTTNINYGYNLDSGGTKNKKLSEFTKQKIREAKIGKSNGPRSEETKKKIAAANKGKILSGETKQKISEARKECWKNEDYRLNQLEKHKWQTGENHPWWGKHHTEETKKKISESRKRVEITEETRKKLSVANSGTGNPFYGQKHSAESIKKMSDAHKGSKNGFAKMAVQLDKNNNLIRIWDCVQQASDELDIPACAIGLCCRGGQKTSGGFNWKYVYDQVNRKGIIIQGAISLGIITEEEIENVKNSCV